MPPVHCTPWLAYFNRWTDDPITGRPGSLLCVAPEDLPPPPRPAGGPPPPTIESLLLSGFAPPPAPCLVAAPIHFEGWLYKVSKGTLMRKEVRAEDAPAPAPRQIIYEDL